MIAEIAVDRRRQRLAFWLVVAGVGFNLALCFISTNLHSISEAEVTACEIAILAAGAMTVLADLDGNLICAAALLTGWLLAVHIIDPALGQTAFVALAIPVVYVVLGQPAYAAHGRPAGPDLVCRHTGRRIAGDDGPFAV